MAHNQQTPRLETTGHLSHPRPLQDQQRPAHLQYLNQQRAAASPGGGPSYANSFSQNTKYTNIQSQNPTLAPSAGGQPHFNSSSGAYSNTTSGVGQGSHFAARPSPLPLSLQTQTHRQQQPPNQPLPWMSQQRQTLPQQQQYIKQDSRPTSANSFMGMLTDGDAPSANNPADRKTQNPFQVGFTVT